MSIFRKILFFVFVLVYVTICPIIIMDSLGLIYKPTTQSIERTGVIYLSTVPSEARVHINRKLVEDPTPALIAGLLPGNYHIRLVKKGYKDWDKILPVHEQKSTSLENIMLIPLEWHQTALDGIYEELIPIDKSSYLLLRKGPKLKDLEIFQETAAKPPEDAQEGAGKNPRPLIESADALAEAHLLKITSQAASPYVLIQVRQDRQVRQLWVDLGAKPAAVKDVSQLIPETDAPPQWAKNEPNKLYYLQDQTLHYVNLEQQTVVPILSSVNQFAIHDGQLFVITSENLLKRFNDQGTDEETILDDPELTKKLFEPYKDIDIRVFKDNLMVFLTEKGTLMLNHLPHIFVEEGIRGFDYREEDRRLVVWDGRDIGIIDINFGPNEELFEIGPQVRWLGITERNIQQAFFVNDGLNIVFRDGDTLFLTETANYGQPVAHDITKIHKNSSVTYNHHENSLYYLEADKGHLSVIRLGPRSFTLALPSNN